MHRKGAKCFNLPQCLAQKKTFSTPEAENHIMGLRSYLFGTWLLLLILSGSLTSFYGRTATTSWIKTVWRKCHMVTQTAKHCHKIMN